MLDNSNEADLYLKDEFSIDVDDGQMVVFGEREIAWIDISKEDELENEEDELHPTTLCKMQNRCFSRGLVDVPRNLAWVPIHNGTVRAYSGKDKKQVALLSLQKQEKNASPAEFNICRIGDSIIGAGFTNRLSVWNIQHALDQYQNAGQEGTTPRIVAVEEDSSSAFRCGDIQSLGSIRYVNWCGPNRWTE